ncbi:T9SS type A sorting domain-containing protein [Eudoraea sp.]|uniref:T9SS type A sorting domain-containing protein n=1 Tax=Eudoraea sp. TaxID=1979955 RepID=UPI003C75FF83
MYPNPALTRPNILSNYSHFSTDLYDLQEKQVMSFAIEKKFSTSHLQSGIYFLIIKTNNGLIESQKLVVRK